MTSTLYRKSRSGFTLGELLITIFLSFVLLVFVVIAITLLIVYLYNHM